MSALSQDKVGAYLNTHFVSAVQKVGTFTITGGGKAGGNVASYFCTPEGLVLHAVAGPAKGEDFLQEARWVVELLNLMQLENLKSTLQVREFTRRAQFERLIKEPTWSKGKVLPAYATNPAYLLNSHRGLSNRGKVHLLMTAYPLSRLELVYRPVFQNILGEKVSTEPVRVTGK